MIWFLKSILKIFGKSLVNFESMNEALKKIYLINVQWFKIP